MTVRKEIFYAKLRPQKADIAGLCRDLQKIFVGYPAWRRGILESVQPSPEQLIDPSQREDRIDGTELSEALENPKNYAKSVNKQRGRIRKIGPGSIVLVPRLGEGVFHAARIVSEFRLFNAEKWADRYLDERRHARLDVVDRSSHVGDVMQGWETGPWMTIPFPAIPRWVSQTALARDTIGIVSSAEDGRTAWDVVDAIVAGCGTLSRPRVRTGEELVQRMHDFLSPSIFEHLCVDLMQLENPTEFWTHVGGSGDGGADGLGYGPEGRVAAVLQCKYQWSGAITDPRHLDAVGRAETRLILGSVVHKGRRPAKLPADAEWLGATEVANLVLKHRARLPIAITLGVEGAL